MANFSLAWDAHKQNICNGLAALQQNGEFVDMTLAADGHHVKVHQMVLSLASPYLKEIITSIQTPHPVIFLNKISYPILSAILEYIYTGEVMIEKDCLNDLVEAAKDLHIKGLHDLTDVKYELQTSETFTTSAKMTQGQPLADYISCDKSHEEIEHPAHSESENIDNEPSFADTMETDYYEEEMKGEVNTRKKESDHPETQIQYTVSNQGSLIMILNRCMYRLRYTSVRGPTAGHRQWRCVEYTRRKCPALAITKNDVVIKRHAAHNHPFHDKKILKKVSESAVFSTIKDAEVVGLTIKQGKDKSNAANKEVVGSHITQEKKKSNAANKDN